MKFTTLTLLALLALSLVGCGSDNSTTETTGTTTAGASQDAKKPAYKNIVLTDDKEGKAPKTAFTKDTPEIVVFFDLENVPSGSKIRGVWICEKSEVAEPNFKIDEKTLEIGPLINSGNFSLSKPTAGWPVGDYRVEMYVDDALTETVKFKVE